MKHGLFLFFLALVGTQSQRVCGACKGYDKYCRDDCVGDHISAVIADRVRPYAHSFGSIRAPEKSARENRAEATDKSDTDGSNGIANKSSLAEKS